MKNMYKLYLDKSEDFICEIQVKNASLKNSMARLVVESTDGPNFVFNGKIENGKCVVPIHRLKGLLDENTRGNMHLEIIVENTYFKPWSSDFIVEEHTSVKVKVNESKQPTKPSVTVKVPKAQPKKLRGTWSQSWNSRASAISSDLPEETSHHTKKISDTLLVSISELTPSSHLTERTFWEWFGIY